MPRPVVFIFLMLTFIATSQFEWRRQFMDELERRPDDAMNLQQPLKEEDVAREKVILQQEKSIQQLTQLAQSLRHQLLQCRAVNDSSAFGEPPVRRPSLVNGEAAPEEIV